MFKSRIAKLAQWLVFGAVLSQSAMADTQYSYLNQGVPPVVFQSINLGRTNPNKVITINVNLAPSSPAALQAYANSVSNPKSPNYRKFLTPAEIGTRFGQSLANFTNVVNHLKANGLVIKLAAKNRLNVVATGKISNVEAAFKTAFNDYRTISTTDPENQLYYSHARALQVPSNLKGVVRSITGVQSHTKPQRRAVALTPAQTHVLYGIAPIYSDYKGEGRNIGISNWDGFDIAKNVPLFLTAFGLPAPAGGAGSNIKVITTDGGSGSGPAGGEADLDIQMVLSQAPLCNLYVYDGAGFPSTTLAKEADDNLVDIVSESWGWRLPTDEALACHVLHQVMSVQGITYMAASGDFGTESFGFEYPNFEPEVLQVGGTIATVNAAGVRQNEVTWVGSGSGWSARTDSFNTLPPYQVGPTVPVGNNHRLYPDVALNASGNGTGAYQFYFEGAVTSDFSGTSFASPVFAGALGIVEQKLIKLNSLPTGSSGRARFGRIQDVFYAQQGRPDVWFDVVDGPSTGTLKDGTLALPGPGWDYTTGWGAPNFDAFVTAYAMPPVLAAPATVSLYTGNYVAGDKLALAAVDGLTYDVSTNQYSGVGQMTGERVNFKLTSPGSKIQSMVLSTTCSSHDLATVQIFALNVNTGVYDLLKAFPGTFGQTENKFAVSSPANYVSSTGAVALVIRAIAPDRLATGSFVLSTDQTLLTVQVRP